MCFSKTQALSPQGRCATFDVAGDGIVISEGIAMIALKRLVDAERDGDRIYAVIKGVGASSDGSAKGMTAPLPAGQLRAMRRAYAMAGFGPTAVQMFEAHGTGTVAGDSAEIESTSRLLAEGGATPRQAIVGSVKTIIGHTKATAGAAGLLKAALALHHKVLPPHGHVDQPIEGLANPVAPLCVLDEAMPWLTPAATPRRAACSAFGFGGTNFHVVLEEYADEYRDWLLPAPADQWSAELLLWRADDRDALLARVEAFAAGFAEVEGLELRDVAASLAARFGAGGHTLAIVAKNARDLRAKLAPAIAYLKGGAKAPPPGVYAGSVAKPAGKVAVVFSGQGSQYPNMAREAALHFGAVRDALGEADEILRAEFEQRFGRGASLSRFIYPRGAYDDKAKALARQLLASTDVAQPALGAVETGLFRLLGSLGLAADMYAGHSYGEFAALHAAGAIDFPSLMRISAARGRFIVDAARAEGAELGTMAAVNAPRAVVESALAGLEGVILANHNAPLQSVISGTRAGVEAASAKLAAAGAEVTPIPVAAAFHSVLVRPAQKSLGELIASTPWARARVPVYSNGTARPHAEEPAAVQRQMAEHLVQPVEFVAEVEAMYADGARVFVELGPKAVLARLVSRILDGREHVAIAVDDGTGLGGLLGGIAQLLCAGVRLDVARLYARRDCRTGDPTQPAALRRLQTISKHAWMLNGGGARRASAPRRQVGLTLEAVAARDAARPPATPAPARADAAPAAATAASPTAPPSAPTTHFPVARATRHTLISARRKERPMDDRRPPAGTTDASVMSEYFETMRHFLESQERVMAAFLGDGGGYRPQARPRSLPASSARVAELAAAPVVAPTAKPHVPVHAPAPAPVARPAEAAPAPAAPKPLNGVNGANGAAHPAAAATPAPAAAAPAAEPAKANGNGAALTRDKVLDMLLGIVEETTGYPRDMLGLDQNLEADLGIDSIKRVEVVGALLKQLPAAQRDVLTQSRGKLNTQSTLNGIVDLVTQAQAAGGAAGPFESAGAGKTTAKAARPSRLVMRPQPEPLPPSAGRHLTPGTFLLTRDAAGLAAALAAQLGRRGAEVAFIEPEVLADEARLIEFCNALPASTAVAGLVHLAAFGAAAVAATDGPDEWRAQIQLGEKSFFVLLRQLYGRLVEHAHVVTVSGFGGLYGREGSGDGVLRLQGGGPGLLKSLREERPELRVKAIDLDPARAPQSLAADVLAEIELDGGRQEVGYPGGRRTVFVTVAEGAVADDARESALHDLVVLATGGARGVTAEVLRELARPGNTLVLTGRSRLPDVEPADTAGLADAAALRNHFVAQIRTGAAKMTPGDIQRRVRSILDLREMRANLADFRAAGATVEYHSVDVTSESDLARLVTDVTRRHGRIDGLVHGAGVIEDKLVVDKASDSWSRVIETKVIGLLLLQKLLDPAALRFLAVFSSVAGRYGNSGQSDYATANELMNRICVQLQARFGSRTAVSALCWGPWGPTKFGTGMVTPETEAKFEQRGVGLVSAALGRRLFREELTRRDGTPVEIICGEGPWEEEESSRGVIRHVERTAGDAGPLLGDAEIESQPTGGKILRLPLDAGRHALLGDDAAPGDSPLPVAAAVELLAEAARRIWPKWCVVEAREVRTLAPLAAGTDRIELHLSPPPYGSSQGFDVSAAVKTAGADSLPQVHFQCVIRLEQALPVAMPTERSTHRERSLGIAEAYAQLPPRAEPRRTLAAIHGLSSAGATAQLRAASARTDGAPFVFDPTLLDAAGQILSLWARVYLDDVVAPARYGRVVRYGDRGHGSLHVEFAVTASEPGTLRGTVTFLDERDAPVLAVEDIEADTRGARQAANGAARGTENRAI
jgi:acyl transferase domain-containing protein